MPTVTHIIDSNLPVYATGNQTISGNKSFKNSITYGLGSGIFDFGLITNISTESGGGVSFTRGGLIPTPHGYGIVFEGGSAVNKKGYLTLGATPAPISYEYATLDWTKRILSGQWKTDKRLLVNGSGVLLEGESSQLFNGDREIKSLPVLNTNYGGTTISEFLENMFFPYQEATITLNAPTIYTYGINSISSINFGGSITQKDDIITGIAYRNFEAILSGPEPLTAAGNIPFFYEKNGVSLNQTITQTSQELNTLLYVTKNGNPDVRNSNLRPIRFEPIYYYGLSASDDLTMGETYDNSIFNFFNTSIPANYTYSLGSRPANVIHTFEPNNQYIYFIYPSPASTQDSIINWGNSLSSIYDVNANFEYINTYSNLGTINITFPNHILRYRVYKSNDLITLQPGESLNLRFTFGN